MSWNTGTPNIPHGSRRTFWCAIRGANGRIYHRFLDYVNGYIMPLSDECYDAPTNAIPVDDEGLEFRWFGWHEVSCDSCDTQWAYTQEVVAWMELPKFGELLPENGGAE